MEWKEDFSSRLYRNSCKSNATKKNRNIDLSILPLFSTFQIVREKKKIKGKKKIVVLEKENLSVEDTRRERNSTKRYIYTYSVYLIRVFRRHSTKSPLAFTKRMTRSRVQRGRFKVFPRARGGHSRSRGGGNQHFHVQDSSRKNG